MAHISQWDNHPYIKDLPHNLERLGGPSEVQSNFKFCGMIAIACHSYSYTPWERHTPKKNSDELRKAMEVPLQAFFPSQDVFTPASTKRLIHPGQYQPWPQPRVAAESTGSSSQQMQPGVHFQQLRRVELAEGSLHPQVSHGFKDIWSGSVFVRKRPVTWMAAMMNIDEYRWISMNIDEYRWI